jgi:hypothetical protein
MRQGLEELGFESLWPDVSPHGSECREVHFSFLNLPEIIDRGDARKKFSLTTDSGALAAWSGSRTAVWL